MTSTIASPNIHDTLGLTPRRRRRRFVRSIVVGVAVVALVFIAMLLRSSGADAGVRYKTEQVKTGALLVTVTATGELKPLTQVNIGTEISGMSTFLNVRRHTPRPRVPRNRLMSPPGGSWSKCA